MKQGNKMNINEKVANLAANGLALKLIKATLTLDGYSVKAINEACKGCSALTTRSQGFRHQFYALLAESQRSTEDVNDYIVEQGSANVINKSQNFLDIANLAREIHEKAATRAEPPRNEKELAFAALELLEAEFKIKGYSKALENRSHPDKVSHLNSENLTALYTALFQQVNASKPS